MALAARNRGHGIIIVPATTGMKGLKPPMNFPPMMLSAPHRSKAACPFGISSGNFDMGQVFATSSLKWRPSQKETQSPTQAPVAAASQIGQNSPPAAL